ncbi:DUF6228 family protein [Actinokineospora terrae]|uniref:Uncharacterized protein n=1 Tax=Actinokineospora terrae TaxID=155974 RepID=A0A1H9MY68_9PSEU|nr:DUF6228 family protein [Actinokineospora terrae]SER28409.1 hypothetical protein SAMN04487818_102395 [Actinokineospora terrae]
MTCSSCHGPSCVDEDAVVVRCTLDSSVTLTFCDRHVEWVGEYYGGTDFTVHARSHRLDAVIDTNDCEVDTGLADFIEGLDFRGWSGARRWHSRQLAVSALYESRGYVKLSWTLRCDEYTEYWNTTVVMWVEAGSAKDDLAARLHVFLSGPD